MEDSFGNYGRHIQIIGKAFSCRKNDINTEGTLKYFLIPLLLITVSNLIYAQRFDNEQPRSHLATSEECILFGDDFEKQCWDTFNPGTDHPSKCPGEGVQWKHAQLQNPQAISYVMNPVRAGKLAVRFKWLHENPGGWLGDPDKVSNNEKKAMLHAPGVKENQGSERWYGFSIYFPSEGMKKDAFNSLFFQLHATPDHDLDERWRQPAAAMTLTDKGLKADWTWDSARVSPHNSNIINNRTTLNIPGERETYMDRWVDIVWHVGVDYTDATQGFVQIWVDGKQVADYPNIRFGYNDSIGLYPSYGMYWFQGKAEHDHWVYVDEVRIGGASCSYEDVAPGHD